MQVGLARIQSLPVLGLSPHADVHMRVGLVVVQDHHVPAFRQIDLTMDTGADFSAEYQAALKLQKP